MEFPYLTADAPPAPGIYKSRWEDFEVWELPATEPAGRGDHTWFEIEKLGLPTPTAVADVARALGVKSSSVGYAGLKDARAVARQWLSVERVAPERVRALAIPRIRVLRAERHPRKLRRGWHAGNRFLIRLRPPSPDHPAWSAGDTVAEATRRLLGTLERRGVPNYYGPQRFGSRGDTWRVGRALARQDWMEAVSLIAGRPLRPGDPGVAPAAGVHPDRDDVLRARELFDQGRFGEAVAVWPRGFGQCARVASAMVRTGGDPARAVRAVGKPMLRLYASAYQGWLFNHGLAHRIENVDRLMQGDLAWKHDTEALFLVEDPAREQIRAERFEVSATGPLVGRHLREPAARAAEMEREALRQAGFDPAELDSAVMRPLTGRRRPLRFPLRDVAVARVADDAGDHLELCFRLPPGCYATAVLRELGKGEIIERGG
jgi:tRNA pseudouridine13 synthase